MKINNTVVEDSYRHKGLRKKLVEVLKNKGIIDERILSAIGIIPRHIFMDSSFINFSYSDQAFPIAAGQTISQPYTVAFQTSLLEIKPMDKVLEVGTGSGYQTAVLLELGAKVFTIERQRELFLKAQSALKMLGYKPQFFYGDGYEGIPSYQPYDKILVTAAAPIVPQKLLEQLKVGGKLVIPVGGDSGQTMMLIVRESENSFIRSEHGAFAFVPLLKGKAG
ncbi:MAG: protein-L-isoaspartate(D-aspartate) O-methyltransferase [Bacteroidales bacterium]|nr:protein-L-isoaspartate(D-aspartate) O-methyltransferase [Bacteroidales bacterium]MCB9013149.1 protein-L-isoaspartate(D-aspartate) O-methyltransferase [Bacteroidales bacterium]